MLKDIIVAYDNCCAAGIKTALVTVVHVVGSSYRGPGARMLIDARGNLTDAISGGCLEGDALRKALNAISQNKNRLVTYDTNNEDDAAFGVQLGCAGIIQVLFEPIDVVDGNNPMELLRKIISERKEVVLMTFFNAENKNAIQLGTRILVKGKEQKTKDNKQEAKGTEQKEKDNEQYFPFDSSLLHDYAIDVLLKKKSFFKTLELENIHVIVFFEFIPPPIALNIVGAGNDAIPLVQMAEILGWDVQIIDGRSTHAKAERFASTCAINVVGFQNLHHLNLHIDDQTAFVLMTHNYNYDLAMLRLLLTKKVKYIGVLGPKKKLDLILETLKSEGIELTSAQRKSIYSPVGLDIGAETPEDIALSIVSEIKAVFSKNKSGFLKNKNKPIHERAISNEISIFSPSCD